MESLQRHLPSDPHVPTPEHCGAWENKGRRKAVKSEGTGGTFELEDKITPSVFSPAPSISLSKTSQDQGRRQRERRKGRKRLREKERRKFTMYHRFSRSLSPFFSAVETQDKDTVSTEQMHPD